VAALVLPDGPLIAVTDSHDRMVQVCDLATRTPLGDPLINPRCWAAPTLTYGAHSSSAAHDHTVRARAHFQLALTS
jgi:hypothetical protein